MLGTDSFRIILTQPEESASFLVEKLKENHYAVSHLPMIKTVAANLSPNDMNILHHNTSFDWIVFTSKNGVRFFFETLKKHSFTCFNTKFSVIGKKTQLALKQYHVDATFVSSGNTSADLWQEWSPYLRPEDRILLVLGEKAPDDLASLIGASHLVTRLNVYQTVSVDYEPEYVWKALCDADRIVVTSPSGVQQLANLCAANWPLLDGRLVCIGTTTAKSVARLGHKKYFVAQTASESGLFEMIEASF